jgi:hypothetical protein
MIWARSVLWAVLADGPLSASKVRPAVSPLLLALALGGSWVISSH